MFALLCRFQQQYSLHGSSRVQYSQDTDIQNVTISWGHESLYQKASCYYWFGKGHTSPATLKPPCTKRSEFSLPKVAYMTAFCRGRRKVMRLCLKWVKHKEHVQEESLGRKQLNFDFKSCTEKPVEKVCSSFPLAL